MSEPVKDDNEAIHPIGRALSFVDGKGFRNGVNIALGVLAIGLGLLDFVLHRHGYFAFEENTKGFYALYGFIAFSFVVVMGWPLRRLLGRPESYYENEGGDG